MRRYILLFVVCLLWTNGIRAEIASGTCGNYGANVTWVLDDDGTLSFSGSGDIQSYDVDKPAPWYPYITQINALSFGDEIKGIGNYAFKDCTCITSVVIPSTVMTIGWGAFRDCTGLTSLTFSKETPILGIWAFSGCTSLSEITNEGLTPQNITSEVFSSSVFDTATLRVRTASVTAYKAHQYWGQFANIVGNGDEYIERGTCGDKDDNVTWVLDNDSVLTISGSGDMKDFRYQKYAPWRSLPVMKLVMEEGVTSIGESAFADCKWMTTATLATSVTKIGKSAFSNCSRLTSIDMPELLMSIGASAFADCSSLTSVIVPDGVTSIEEKVFYNCSDLESVTLDNSVTRLGTYSFAYCTKLTAFEVPNSVTVIEGRAFEGCSGLTSVSIPSSVTSIGDLAFRYCNDLSVVDITSLESWCMINFGSNEANPLIYAHNLYLNGEKLTDLVVPDNVTEVKPYAFWGYTGMKTLTIPSSVTKIGKRAFSHCSEMVSADISNSVATIDAEAFYMCSSLASFNIPSSMSVINERVFYGCEGITVLDIPENITNIKDAAFNWCSGLTKLTLLPTLQSISNDAFWGCRSLRTIINEAATPQRIYNSTFDIITMEEATLKVPKGAKSLYEVTSIWKNFNIITEEEIDGIESITLDTTSKGTKKYMDNNRVVILKDGKRYNVCGSKYPRRT